MEAESRIDRAVIKQCGRTFWRPAAKDLELVSNDCMRSEHFHVSVSSCISHSAVLSVTAISEWWKWRSLWLLWSIIVKVRE